MPENFEEACYQVAKEIAELVIAKQKKYSHGNINAFGELGVLVRTSDKVERLKNMIMNNIEDTHEPKMDSWFDLAGYSILAIMLDRDWFKLEVGK